MRKKEPIVINIGTVSLILVFSVLALVVFALLSFVSASGNWRMAEKMAERMNQYYAAEVQAAELTAQALETADFLADQEKARETDPKEKVQSWQIPVGETQYLAVTIKVLPKENKWKIVQWNLEQTELTEEKAEKRLYRQENGEG